MMKPKVYIETTIPSYLTARPSRDLLMAAHQQARHTWWNDKRNKFDLFISQFVEDECRAGDPQMADRRIELLKDIPMFGLFPDVYLLAAKLIAGGPLPEKAETDALHIAVAAANRADYLLTWNMKHIANPAMQRAIGSICLESGFDPPVISTPELLLEA